MDFSEPLLQKQEYVKGQFKDIELSQRLSIGRPTGVWELRCESKVPTLEVADENMVRRVPPSFCDHFTEAYDEIKTTFWTLPGKQRYSWV